MCFITTLPPLAVLNFKSHSQAKRSKVQNGSSLVNPFFLALTHIAKQLEILIEIAVFGCQP